MKTKLKNGEEMPSATSGMAINKKPPVPTSADELDVVPRLYKQLGKLLDQLEKQDILEDGVTVPQRISSLIACGRIMKIFQDLKRGELNVGAGSAINQYAAAFKTAYDPSGRSANPRPANVVEFNSGADPDTDPYSDSDD